MRRHAPCERANRAEVGRGPDVTSAPLLLLAARLPREQLAKVEIERLRHVGAVDREQRNCAVVQRLGPDGRRRARVGRDLDAAELRVAQRAVGMEYPLLVPRGRLRPFALAMVPSSECEPEIGLAAMLAATLLSCVATKLTVQWLVPNAYDRR